MEYFIERGDKFSHIYVINITTISKKRYTTYEFYSKQPVQMVELKMNMIIDNNRHHRKALDRSVKHPLNTKYSHILVKNLHDLNS